MAEETTQIVKKSKWWQKLLKLGLKSPVNTVFVLALIYFSLQAFVFDNSMHSKVVLFGVICLWAFWFVAKQVFAALIALGLLCSGGYLYYEYTHKEIKKCEASGGYWNKETKTCEAKVPLLEQAKRYLKKAVMEVQKSESKDETKDK
ncbi:MAG: hypothetical protein IJ545_02905 [Alphaproteobacteria bacterium]|nr:hypothetical protein [Alphaproteobacteria bacterium]